jgi:DNA replication protein DnaC
LDFSYQPSIENTQVQTLPSCHYVEHCDNVLVLGPLGVGKTHLAVALSLKVIDAGFTTDANLIAALSRAHAERERESLLDEKPKVYREVGKTAANLPNNGRQKSGLQL